MDFLSDSEISEEELDSETQDGEFIETLLRGKFHTAAPGEDFDFESSSDGSESSNDDSDSGMDDEINEWEYNAQNHQPRYNEYFDCPEQVSSSDGRNDQHVIGHDARTQQNREVQMNYDESDSNLVNSESLEVGNNLDYTLESVTSLVTLDERNNVRLLFSNIWLRNILIHDLRTKASLGHEHVSQEK